MDHEEEINNKRLTAENTPNLPPGRRYVKDAEKDHHWLMAILILIMGIAFLIVAPEFINKIENMNLILGTGTITFFIIWSLSTVGCMSDLVHKRFSFFNKLGMFIALLSPFIFLSFAFMTYTGLLGEFVASGIQDSLSEFQKTMPSGIAIN